MRSARDVLSNPFELLRASDYSDSEILDHWVDVSGSLAAVLKPKALIPMVLLGGKGSGKTHLMRYCSAPVQSARHGGNLRKAIEAEGYVGIYVRAEGLNTGKFAGKGQSEEVWSSIFSMYFELWLATNLLIILQDYLADYVTDGPTRFSERKFAESIAELFDEDVRGDFTSVASLLRYLTIVRKQIDLAVNNSALTNKLSGVTISFSPGQLAFGIPKIVASCVGELKATRFVYLIDEAENFTANQQRFLNSLIRYRSGNATIKVGARLYGIRTFETLGSGEPIKVDAEYERVDLDSILRQTDYEKLATELIAKRLQASSHLSPEEASNPRLLFEELDRTKFWQSSTLKLVEKYDARNRDRPYFGKLRSQLDHLLNVRGDVAQKVIDRLRMPMFPLLEKTNILLLYRQWPKTRKELDETVSRISTTAANFVEEGHSGASAYAEVVAHFDSDLLAQLYRDCRSKVPYAGLSTLIELSQFIPRNLLSILKHVYRQSSFAGETPFAGGRISVEAQSQGVRDSAAWFWQDAQPDGNVTEVKEGIEALAVLFRTIRYSERPAECDLCTFSVNLEALSQGAQRTIHVAENWSYLLRIRDGAKNKNTDSLDTKFQLGPMLAPRWEISQHRRGAVEVKKDLADAMFDPQKRSELVGLFKKRVSGMFLPAAPAKKSAQNELFA